MQFPLILAALLTTYLPHVANAEDMGATAKVVADAVTEISRQHTVTLIQLPQESQLVWMLVYGVLGLASILLLVFLVSRWLRPAGAVPATVVTEMIAAHERHMQQITDEAERSIAALVHQIENMGNAIKQVAARASEPHDGKGETE